MKMKQIIARLEHDNPQLEVRDEPSTSHLKLYIGGRLIGVLPRKCAKEGLALNTRAQLRREGIQI